MASLPSKDSSSGNVQLQRLGSTKGSLASPTGPGRGSPRGTDASPNGGAAPGTFWASSAGSLRPGTSSSMAPRTPAQGSTLGRIPSLRQSAVSPAQASTAATTPSGVPAPGASQRGAPGPMLGVEVALRPGTAAPAPRSAQQGVSPRVRGDVPLGASSYAEDSAALSTRPSTAPVAGMLGAAARAGSLASASSGGLEPSAGLGGGMDRQTSALGSELDGPATTTGNRLLENIQVRACGRVGGWVGGRAI